MATKEGTGGIPERVPPVPSHSGTMLCRSVLVIGFMLGWCSWSTAQNLVPNPSFETYKQYPCTLRIDPPNNIGDYLLNWYAPTFGTPDIWNGQSSADTCSNSLFLRPKTEFIDSTHISPRTGQFYMGLFSMYTAQNHFGREYLQVKLSQPLIKGKVYKAEMWVRADVRTYRFTNNMGMVFTTQPYVIPADGLFTLPLIPLIPQVNEATVISDTIAWRKVTGQFVATQPFQYLTIGNFFDDQHTRFEPGYAGIFTTMNGAYYHIDDIYVADANVNYLVEVPDLGPDTTLCVGQSLPLHLPETASTTYRWQDGSQVLNRIISQPGTYYVTATTGDYTVSDTIQVKFEESVKLLSVHDTMLCQREQLTLIANDPSSRPLIWNTGQQDSILTVSQTGIYWVRIPTSQCTVADTVHVEFVNCPDQVPNVFTPNGDSKNEVFFIKYIELRPWQLQVFNRWGARVYYSDHYLNEWRGEGLAAGVYYYWLYSPQLKRHIKGWVTILR